MMTKRVWDYDVCKQDRYLIKESLWDYDEKVYARVFCKNVKKWTILTTGNSVITFSKTCIVYRYSICYFDTY